MKKNVQHLIDRFIEIKFQKEIENDKALEKAIMIIAENINLDKRSLERLYLFLYNFYSDKFDKLSNDEIKTYLIIRYSLEVFKNISESGISEIINYILDRTKN